MKSLLNIDFLSKILIFLALAAVFITPELNNNHFDPLPQFWAEMAVAWCVIILLIFVIFFLREITIPFIVLPISLFAIYLALQHYFINIDFIGLSYVAALEMVICILAAISVNSIQNKYGKKTITTLICFAFLIGAILQSLIGFIQYTNLYHHFSNIVFYDTAHPTTDIFGNMGQRNHYCDYISIATFGLIYLFSTQKIKTWAFSTLAIWLAFSLTIAGSRSVFIYFFLSILISGVFYLTAKSDTIKRKVFITIVLFSIFLFIFEFAYPIVLQHVATHHQQIRSGLERIASDYSGGGITGRRLVEWQKALIVFKQHPIFGYGLNEFPKQSIFLQPLFPHAPENDGLFTNCHNLILQLMAETGLIGTVLILGSIIFTIYKIFKNNDLEDLIILCMFFTIFAHSMVEYPLWYMYFLVPFVIFLSCTKSSWKISSNMTILISGIPLIILVYMMINSSIIFNNLVYYNDNPDDLGDFRTQAKYLQNLGNTNLLWAYPAYYSLDNYINVDDTNTDRTFSIKNQLVIENKFTGFHPYPDNIIKQAKLNWILGNKELAKEQVQLALVSYPVYKASFIKSLTEKHGKYADLLKIAKAYSYK